MGKLKAVFNPDGRLNPAKVFPTTKGCGEIRIPPQVGAIAGAGMVATETQRH
jgi:hypothetical protein